MEKRKVGKYGTVMVAQDGGVQLVNVELPLIPSQEIQGETYLNRLFAKAGAIINNEKPMDIRIQGFVKSASITPHPDGANNKILISDLHYYKNAGAKFLNPSADEVLARPLTPGESYWAVIVQDMTTGLADVVYGTATSGSLVEEIGTGAGEIPLVGEDKLVVAAVKLDDVDAPISQDNIVYRLSDGTLLQERADQPKFELMNIFGGVLLQDELLAIHTGNKPRKVFGTFYDVSNSLTELGHTTKWNLDVTNPTTTLPAQNDINSPTETSGPPNWSGGFERYSVDETLFDVAVSHKFTVVKLYRDRTDMSKYYMGCVLVSNWGQTVDQANAILDALSFTGLGPINRVEA